jgi:hypothetical protein
MKMTAAETMVKAIWSFNRKHAPVGWIQKHKVKLCAHGGMEI